MHPLLHDRRRLERSPRHHPHVHEWIKLLRERAKPFRNLWRCSLCWRCFYTRWHNRNITLKSCPKCGMNPCNAQPQKCGHEECRYCTIGHGDIPVINGECEACREWVAMHPGWEEPTDVLEEGRLAG